MFNGDPPDLPPLALIAGPTASGKSGLGNALAQRTGGVIVNADSAQVYRDLRVLSARPTPADEARLPHRLYGARDGAEPCSAADWAADARAAVAEIHAAGRLPILVGGTGLYLRTLLDGIAPIPAIDPAVRAAVRAAGVAENHRALAARDPAAAVKHRASDSQRVARALEVVLSSGRSILDWQREREGGIGTQVRVVARILLPPRPWLHDRIDARFVAMFDDARQEVDALLARRLDPSLPIMNAIGVREVGAYLNGIADREQAIAAGQAATRAYAKRQMTWFRNQPPAAWTRVADVIDRDTMEKLAADIAAGCGGARCGGGIKVAPSSNANEQAAMNILRDVDIDPAALAAKRVAIIGYGNQGRAQALNLRDSGIDVRVGLREGSASTAEVAAASLSILPIAQAAASSDVVMLLAPDEQLGAVYDLIAPVLAPGTAIGFAHGFAIRFGLVTPREDLDVFMVAPKGPGSALRTNYAAGGGMVGLFAVAQDATGRARDLALAYGRAIGCGRAGLLETSFAAECEADLFNEGAVLWGAVPELIVAGFDTLVDAGFAPEIAWLECVGELRLLADLVAARGLAGMREAISTTAEFGALSGGTQIVTDAVRQSMRDVLADVRSGKVAADMLADADAGSPRLLAARAAQRLHASEAVGARLRPIIGD